MSVLAGGAPISGEDPAVDFLRDDRMSGDLTLDAAEPFPLENPDDAPSAGRREEAYPPPVVAWWTVCVLTVLYSLSLMDRQVITLLVQDIRADLHISDFQVGLLHGLAFALFYVTFGLAFGWAADRFPRRGIVFLGVTVWSIAAASCGLARNFTEFLGARFGVGAGEAALNPAAYSIMADSFPKRRLATAMSLFGSGSFLGGAAATAFGGWLIDVLPDSAVLPVLGDLEQWRLVLILTGLPGLLVAFLVWSFREPLRRGRMQVRQTSPASVGAFMKRRWRFFTGHFVGYGLLAASAYGYGAWLPTYMVRQFDLPIAAVGAIVGGMVAVFGMGGTMLSGALADRLFSKGRKDAHLLLFVVMALAQVAVAIAAMSTQSLPVFLGFTAAFLALASYTGTAAAALQIVTPAEYRGQVSSFYLVVFTLLGIGLGPTLVGAFTTYVFADDSKVGWAMALNSALLLPVAALFLGSALKPMRAAVAEADQWTKDDLAAG